MTTITDPHAVNVTFKGHSQTVGRPCRENIKDPGDEIGDSVTNGANANETFMLIEFGFQVAFVNTQHHTGQFYTYAAYMMSRIESHDMAHDDGCRQLIQWMILGNTWFRIPILGMPRMEASLGGIE